MSQPPSPDRLVAFVLNSLPPYRLHLQRRIGRELAGLEIRTLLTHEGGEINETIMADPDIGLVRFGTGQPVSLQAKALHQLEEWRKGGRIIRWLEQNQPAAVVVSTYNDAGRMRIIAWCHRQGIPVFLSADSNIRGDKTSGIRSHIKQVLLKWLLRRCAALLPFGRLGRDYFLRYGADPERIFFFPCEPDYGCFEKTSPQTAGKAPRLNWDQSRRRLLYCGRLAAEKRVDLLLAAFKAIAATRPRWDLVICGDGPQQSSLLHKVPEMLRGRIMWTGFIADEKELAAVYHSCDALVVPSDYEPWGLVVNEAAAAGLALVCSDVVGAAYELLKDGVNGWLFPAADLDALTESLRNLTSDETDLDQMKHNSRVLLDAWKEQTDPVDGLRQALHAAGIPSSKAR